MKKTFTTILMVVFIFMLTGCNKIEGIVDIIDEEQFTFDFGSSTVLIEEDVLAYINEFDTKYMELNKACMFSSYSQFEFISREEVSNSYSTICDMNIVMTNNSFGNIISVIEVGFNISNDVVMSNEDITFGNNHLIIEFNDDALRVTTYSESGSINSQHTLATIDNNLYYNFVYSNDLGQYSKRVYYQNHYVKYEYLSELNYQFYQKNLETSEVIQIITGFLSDRTDHYFTTFIIGDENYINTVYYMGSEDYMIETQQLNGDYVEFKYITDSESAKEIYVNALELDDWNLLKQESTNQYLYKMYNNETPLYEDLLVRNSDAQHMPTIIIDISENSTSVLTVGETNFDLHAIILEHDTFEENHIDLMKYYDLSSDEKTYEDYEDYFQDISDFFNEFING